MNHIAKLINIFGRFHILKNISFEDLKNELILFTKKFYIYLLAKSDNVKIIFAFHRYYKTKMIIDS